MVYMTFTQTITLPRTEVQPVQSQSLHLENEVKVKVKILIEKLLSSPLLSVELLSKLGEWVTEYYPNSFTHPSSQIVNILFILLSDIIRPAMKENKDDDDKLVKLFAMDDSLQKIVVLVIPREKSVTQVIQECEVKADKIRVFEEKMKLMSASYQMQVADIYAQANQKSQDIVADFNRKKENLLLVNERRRLIAEGIHAKLDALTQTVSDLSISAMANGSKAIILGERMDKETREFQDIANKGLKVLEKV